MNCREGDLALVILGKHKGKLIKCLKLLPDYPRVLTTSGSMILLKNTNIWETDAVFGWVLDNSKQIRYANAMLDKYLLPIRPDEITSLSEEELILLTLDV